MKLRNVLIVDDQADIRRLAELAMVTVGHLDVVQAASGEEALIMATTHPIDLIVLDVMMPGMDGATVLERLKADPKTATIPVVLLTARAQNPEMAGYLASGAVGVLGKPFDPMTLADELRRIAEPL